MSDIQVTSIDGNQINVTTGVVVGPLPSLQLAAGTGITIASGGGVSTISANLSELSVAANLADLTDVSAGATSGQVLSYNGAEWGGLTLSVPANLADLSNVNGTPTTGQVLAWNGSTWAPADDQTGGSSNVANLADLADVSSAAPSTGQALVWSGSEWAGGNIPPGTTVNGLSGDVTLLAGDNVAITVDGQNLTIASVGGGDGLTALNGLTGSLTLAAGDGVNIATNGSTITLNATANLSGYATEQFVLDSVGGGLAYDTPRDLALTQTLDGRQHYSWSAPDGYVGGYTVEIAEIGLLQNISGSSQFSPQLDGSVTLTVQMDTTAAARPFVFASPTGADDDYVPIPYSVATLGEGVVTIEGLYLPEEFTSAGTHSLLASVLDVGDEEIGRVVSDPIAFGPHGSPRPPEFFSVDSVGLEITANVESTQTPHMLGFYPLDQITYYLEINQEIDATSGWIRGAGVTATDPIVSVSATATGGGEWHARVVAENPLGFGPPSETVQVSGEPYADSE